MYQSEIIYLVIIDCLQIKHGSDDQRVQLGLAGYSQISDYCQRKNISGIINIFNGATYVPVHQRNISFNGFLMNTFQSQTLWICSDSNQCLSQAWSVLQYSPGTLIVTGLNVGDCITTC